MNSTKDIAQGFTITGLLDESAKTQRRFPVTLLPITDIKDHPDNLTYSMDEKAIERLATSIKEQGLTDLPLVRKLDDGTYQMVSGHRRKAAYTLLSEKDASFAKMPCRIIEGIDDETSVMMLHAANYFTRELSITERAKATQALGIEVERRRALDTSLSGVRTEDVKAAILEEQTGRKVSGKTIKRQETLAELIETRLIGAWRNKAESSLLSASAIESIALLSETEQIRLYDELPKGTVTKSALTNYIDDALAEKKAESEKAARKRKLDAVFLEEIHPHTDERLYVALTALKSYLKKPPFGTVEPDLKAADLLRCLSGFLPKSNDKSLGEGQNPS